MQPIRHHHFPHRSQNRFRMKLKAANIIAFMRQGHNSACSILSGNCKTFRQILPTYYPGMIPVGRYHSWVVSRESFPGCLEIIAESQEGQIMALRHKTYDVHGIQFHPESVLTPQGKEIIKNFLNE